MPRCRKISDEQADIFRELKREGNTMLQVAKITGFPMSTVRDYCLNITPRIVPIDDKKIQDIVTMREQGTTYKDIAAKYGTSIYWVRSVFLNHNKPTETEFFTGDSPAFIY